MNPSAGRHSKHHDGTHRHRNGELTGTVGMHKQWFAAGQTPEAVADRTRKAIERGADAPPRSASLVSFPRGRYDADGTSMTPDLAAALSAFDLTAARRIAIGGRIFPNAISAIVCLVGCSHFKSYKVDWDIVLLTPADEMIHAAIMALDETGIVLDERGFFHHAWDTIMLVCFAMYATDDDAAEELVHTDPRRIVYDCPNAVLGNGRASRSTPIDQAKGEDFYGKALTATRAAIRAAKMLGLGQLMYVVQEHRSISSS